MCYVLGNKLGTKTYFLYFVVIYECFELYQRCKNKVPNNPFDCFTEQNVYQDKIENMKMLLWI